MTYTSEHPIFYVTTDIVCLTIRDGEFQVLLVERGEDPYKGRLALPGGFVKRAEDLDGSARRELSEETSVIAPRHLEQLKSYGAPDRDPRGRIVSVAFLAIAPHLGDATGGSDASSADWHPVDRVLRRGKDLAFDHHQILRDGVERARSKIEYAPIATAFCAREFTVAELRRVYEVILSTELDAANFHRKVTNTEGLLVEVDHAAPRQGRGRPAQLYRKGPAKRIHPPLDLMRRR